MITAEFFKKLETYFGFQIKGHADYPNGGNDIVCASVSSAVQLTVNTITECFGTKADVKVLKDKIQLKLSHSDEKAEKMLEGLLLHLTMLSEDYEGTIKVKITILEV